MRHVMYATIEPFAATREVSSAGINRLPLTAGLARKMPDSGAAAFDAVTWDVPQTLAWLHSRQYKHVALQLPDDLLSCAPALVLALQQGMPPASKVFVLGDTTYNPLAVDEVAAQHMSAQCVVHYGRASLSPVSSLPAYFVFPHVPLDVYKAAALLATSLAPLLQSLPTHSSFSNSMTPDTHEPASVQSVAPAAVVVLLVDQIYHHTLQQLDAAVHAKCADLLRQYRGQLVTSQPIGNCLDPSAGTKQRVSDAVPAPSSSCCGQQVGRPHISNSPLDGEQAAASRNADAAYDSTAATTVNVQAACCGAAAASGGVQAGAAAPLVTVKGAASTTQQPVSECGGDGNACDAVPRSSESTPLQAQHAASTVDSQQLRIAGLCWSLPQICMPAQPTSASTDEPDDNADVIDAQHDDRHSPVPVIYVWLGASDSPAVSALQLTLHGSQWLCIDPAVAAANAASAPSLQQATPAAAFAPNALSSASNILSSAGASAGSGLHTPAVVDVVDLPWTLGVHEGLAPGTQQLLRRRYYLVEKAKDANIVGILVGTLATAGFLEAVERVRDLAIAAGKKTYTLLMGKPNPAKLANFPEIEVFVMIADPLGLVLDSKPYLAPIITPWEAALAFTGQSLGAHYSLDFADVLKDPQFALPSQISDPAVDAAGEASSELQVTVAGSNNQLHAVQQQREVAVYGNTRSNGLSLSANRSNGLTLSTGGGGRQIAVRSAAQYLTQQRTYTGLESPLTGADAKPVVMAVAGRAGRAAGYAHEGTQEATADPAEDPLTSRPAAV